MSKEQIHDEQIMPLMEQIVDICRLHGIAMITSFDLDDSPESEGLRCTSSIPDQNGNAPASFMKALAIIKPPEGKPLNLTVTDGDGNITEMITILG